MQATLSTALVIAALGLGLIFIVRAYIKVHDFSHNHYRITGDEVRNTNNDKDRIL